MAIISSPLRSWKHLVLWVIPTVALIYLTTRVLAFIHIFGTHAGTILTQVEVAEAYKHRNLTTEEAVVPRIIHQVFHNWTDPDNEVVPADWLETRQTCIDFNPDWEHRLWTVQTSRDFIINEYPWFLHTYDSFRFPVQRIDTLRYFLMLHYGGVYMDLDNGCSASLEPLRYYPTWVVDGARGALSNDNLGAAPHHPFWQLVTDAIQSHAWNYPLPYLTISYATGQWFETEMWEEYHRVKPADAPGLTRINTDGREGASPAVFFFRTRGGTWDNWDNRMFGWIGTHLVTFIVILVALIGLGVGGLVLLWRCVSTLRARRRGYARVDSATGE